MNKPLTLSDKCYFIDKIKEDLKWKREEFDELLRASNDDALEVLKNEIIVLERRFDLIMGVE